MLKLLFFTALRLSSNANANPNLETLVACRNDHQSLVVQQLTIRDQVLFRFILKTPEFARQREVEQEYYNGQPNGVYVSYLERISPYYGGYLYSDNQSEFVEFYRGECKTIR